MLRAVFHICNVETLTLGVAVSQLQIQHRKIIMRTRRKQEENVTQV